jgi:hypothetical protein
MPTQDSSSAGPLANFDAICRRTPSLGLAVRGAYHPAPGEFDRELPDVNAATLVLLGFTGSEQWQHFQRSAEAKDGLPHPLDRWSRRVIGALAQEFGAADVYPNGEHCLLPFQQLALNSEPVHRSPIGLLIHPSWGLWHAYRGALIFAYRIALPDPVPLANPCDACAAKPCLTGCPVGAFRPGLFDVQACTHHVSNNAGSACRNGGCLARRACPIGTGSRYNEDQMRFHMRAFLSAATTAARCLPGC